MLKAILVVAALFCGCSAVITDNTFSATIRMTNMSSTIGTFTGTIHYNYATSFQRINYNVGSGISEIIDFRPGQRLRYLKCATACETSTYNPLMPVYFQQPSDITTTGGVAGCNTQVFRKPNTTASGGVRFIYFDASNNLCRADYVDGRTFYFTNFNATTPDPAVLSAYNTTWNCPARQCYVQIDIMLVMDESGSITEGDFRIGKDFMLSIADSYTFGSNGVQMGVVMFAWYSRLIIGLSNSKIGVKNAIESITQYSGATCIGCGIHAANAEMQARARANVNKVIIVITDGANNVNFYDLNDEADDGKSRGYLYFAIGITNQVNQAELIGISSNIPGQQTAFFTADFSGLQSVLSSLIASTCQDLPGNLCGAGCRGFCSCGQTCICPSTCDDGNDCTTDFCNQNENGAGCQNPPTNCQDGDPCTNNTCVHPGGCRSNPVNCNDTSMCTVDGCTPFAGCTHTPVTCNDFNPCTADTCNAGSGCVYTPVPCDRCNLTGTVTVCPAQRCNRGDCVPSTGNCSYTPFNCDDGNACTNDACDPNLGANGQCTHTAINCNDQLACTLDSCLPASGCVHTVITAADCDDASNCTIDACIEPTGCVNTPKDCFRGDLCEDLSCNSLTGCTYGPKDCEKEPRIAALLGNCYTALCNASRNGCYHYWYRSYLCCHRYLRWKEGL